MKYGALRNHIGGGFVAIHCIRPFLDVYITRRGSVQFWTQAKKMTTKWNREAGVNWKS